MEAERVMVHGIEVKPGQVWACAQGLSPSRVVSIGVKDGRALLRLSEVDNLGDWADWSPDCFARIHTHVVSPDAVVTAPAPEPASKEPERWTDAEFAAEQVALARRQAEVARAEAREARAWAERCENLATAALEEARKLREDASTSEDAWLKSIGEVVAERDKLRADLDRAEGELHTARAERYRLRAIVESDRTLAGEASEAWAVLTGGDPQSGRPAGSCVTEARRVVARREELAGVLDATISELAEARAALEAARAAVLADRRKRAEGGYAAAPDWAALNGGAAVHTPSPVVDDRRWSHPARDEHPDQRLVDGIVDAASAARRGAPRVVAEGRDPGTRTRALPVVPAQPSECWTCDHEAGGYCYHHAQPLPDAYREIVGITPPDWCPLRELAKAGGL